MICGHISNLARVAGARCVPFSLRLASCRWTHAASLPEHLQLAVNNAANDVHFTSPIPTPAAGTVVLRPYQEECVKICLDALASGENRIGVCLPT